jgi:hypothetical protein
MVPLADVFNHKASVVHFGDRYAIAELNDPSPESASEGEYPSDATGGDDPLKANQLSLDASELIDSFQAKQAAVRPESACAKRSRGREAPPIEANQLAKERRVMPTDSRPGGCNAVDSCEPMGSSSDEAAHDAQGMSGAEARNGHCLQQGSEERGSEDLPESSSTSEGEPGSGAAVGGADAAAEAAFYSTFSSCNLKLEIAICCEDASKGKAGEELTIVAAQDLAPGAEVHNTYGENSNDALLYQYGFALRTNPFHCLKFTAKEIGQQMVQCSRSDEVQQHASVAGQTGDGSEGRFLQSAAEEDIEKRLQQFVQVFMFDAPGNGTATKSESVSDAAGAEDDTSEASTGQDDTSLDCGRASDRLDNTKGHRAAWGADKQWEFLLYGNGFTDGLFACALLQLGSSQHEMLAPNASRQTAIDWAAKQLALPGGAEIHGGQHKPTLSALHCTVIDMYFAVTAKTKRPRHHPPPCQAQSISSCDSYDTLLMDCVAT